jgi:hypothetical protein
MMGSSLGTRVLLTTGVTAAPSASLSCQRAAMALSRRMDSAQAKPSPMQFLMPCPNGKNDAQRVRAEEHPASRRQLVAAESDIGGRPPGQHPHRAVQPQRLGDHGAGERETVQGLVAGVVTDERQAGLLVQPFLDIRVLGQQVTRPGQGVACGL